MPLLALLAAVAAAQPAAAATPAAPFALVELFTSEGCSSCPPADRLLGRIAAEAARSGQNVLALAFHVGYWDYLGWTDRFARPEFGRRQRRYAAALSDGVYTPQLVVNGAAAFVGSDESRVRAAIAAALARPAAASLAADAVLHGQAQRVDVRVAGSGLPDGATVEVAVVEDGLSTRVLRGENADSVLRHSRVVRALGALPAGAAAGEVTLDVPPDLVGERSSVVVFAQDRVTGRVLAAAGVPLRRSP
ncbi:MAG TPA: DUF1223 domain-containing protein [Thermoanaerobaculaceae bacterium]|nr:DUF1223 domain-containing protein [Thermoanaerobaculaceae bacterium]